MKPLNIDKTGCSNTSSNCVVWQGPDIECINLCKGDSITEVVYKLALELCKLMDTFDLKNYDLQCFSSGVCQPQDFKDFINILINKVCTLQACNPQCGDACIPCVSGSGSPAAFSAFSAQSSSSDIYVPIAPEFQFKNQKGDDVTVLLVSDYAQAIGNKVSTLVNSTNIIQNTLADHSARIESLEQQGPPQVILPLVTPVSVLPKEPTDMALVLSATEQQFSELKFALGDSNAIYTNLQKIDPNINDLRSLSIPGTNMSGLKGFTAQPTNMADVLGNALVILSDMRIALTNILTNYIPSDCESISLSIEAIYRNNQLVLFIKGTLPALNFVNTDGAPTKFTILDTHGSSVDYAIDIFTIINAPDGYVIDISGTKLITADDLTIRANPSFSHKTSGSICKSYLTTVVVNQAVCPAVTYTPTQNTIGFAFTSSAGTQAYTVEVWNSATSFIVASQTFISNNVQAFNGTFVNLDSTTLYKVRIKININNTEKPCAYSSVTTI